MKAKILFACSLGLGMGVLTGTAAEPASVEQLQQQLQQMQENLNRVVHEQQAQIEALKKQLDAVQQSQAAALVAAAPSPQPANNPTLAAATPPPPLAKPWAPSDPIRLGGSTAYADLGLVATFAAGGSTADDIEGGLELGGHDPNQRGFTVQGVELNLQGAVDPYFRANANIAFLLDSAGDSSVELEEAWMETSSLPGNLQVRGGQMLTDFGRINTQHPHSWGFVDVPIVNGRLLGPDGLRNPGMRVSWLAPTPFYSELFFTVQNSQGETAFSFRDDHGNEPYLGRPNDQGRVRAFTDMLYTARYATSFDLTDNQTLLSGVSAAFGPNGAGANTDTQLYGVDAYWKWKPANAHGGFPFVSLQTEAMLRHMQLGAFTPDANSNPSLQPVPGESVNDWGFYTQALYGFRKAWIAGLRGEYAGRTSQADYEKLYGDDPQRAGRWRISPNLTWYPSEFSKIRLQYNLDDRQDIGVDHSVWLQFEYLLGAHAAHKF